MTHFISEDKPTPVTIIGGYLGSGKTTLVNHLLRNAHGKRLAIMVNEFGDLPIDADLIEAEEDDLISLSGGCVCCSYGSGLIEAFVKLKDIEPKPDHVILEASGVAIPSSISGTLSLLDEYDLDSMINLVDAYHIKSQSTDKYLKDTIERQLLDADLVLLNKADLVNADLLDGVADWLASKTGNAPIINTQFARAPIEILMQTFDHSSSRGPNDVKPHLAGMSTKVVTPEVCESAFGYAKELLAKFPKMVRGKGFVEEKNGQLKTIQIVGKRIDIQQAPAGANPGLIIISQDR